MGGVVPLGVAFENRSAVGAFVWSALPADGPQALKAMPIRKTASSTSRFKNGLPIEDLHGRADAHELGSRLEHSHARHRHALPWLAPQALARAVVA